MAKGPFEDPTISDAVNMRLAAALETISQTSSVLREKYFSDDWRHMKSMRNRISHGYSLLDLELVQGTIEQDVPHFELQLRKALAQIST
ncbi:HepT-like ribonuclease domain-containing protein [Aurantimicrobium minutum]|uniref:HepT-like ribonuclease domain-containing protein n=1 Tax=Aurantimicrobium minutum TaxID=708131 RepID=UPI00247390A8|nr:HepT-like ribonuclease domain-containing protein [Aurantimicrobium minutum]